MKRFIIATTAVLATVSAISWAETLTEYEGRTDTSQDGMYLLFVSRPVSEDSPMGDAFMILGKGDSPSDVKADVNYGMIVDRGIPKLQVLTDEEANAIRSSDDGQPVLVSAVRVDKDEYDQLKTLIDQWSAKTSFDIQIQNALLDCVQEAVKIVDFKRPYRAGLLVPNVMNYFGDIQIANRKKAV